MVKLTREKLYTLVWKRPMRTLAKEFGLCDVALHKICRKHVIPTPPVGYWAKKAHSRKSPSLRSRRWMTGARYRS